MSLSILDLFKIGVGPSSSHTVGPMVAANRFLDALIQQGQLENTRQIRIELYGSLAMTGEGHATDTAVMLGLMGEKPDQLDPDRVPELINHVRNTGQLILAGQYPIPFVEDQHLHFLHGHSLPRHPNGMTLRAFDEAGLELFHDNYYSVG
ncbi:serine dehydratase beta chain, partial [Endozoicomonas sp. SESOKO1]|uniref:serine dehydratase beta chain n=1 Tax=Endozoicomonas sp. SESOKO1 TaxID=2828742 RepID=UPI0027D1F939